MLRKIWIYGALLVIFVTVLSGCSADLGNGSYGNGNGSPGSTGSTGSTGADPNWGAPSKTTGCQVQGPLQDKACTPGDIIKSATKEQICTPGYASSVRNVTTATKSRVYAAYGIKHHVSGEYEIDHLVSLQLGGSNDISNLWPEAASPTPGFHEKDKVENYLHDQLCSGKMSLHDVQVKIATNWLDVYNSMSDKNGSGQDDGDGN